MESPSPVAAALASKGVKVVLADAIEAAEANPLVGPLFFNGRPLTGVPEPVARKKGRFDNTGMMARDKTHFVAGLGTAGTFMGTGRRLRAGPYVNDSRDAAHI